MELAIKDRVTGSLSGTDFTSTILNTSVKAREEIIFQQVLDLGNVPSWTRTGFPVSVTHNGIEGTFWAMPDYFGIGDDEDFCRLPLTPMMATELGDQIGAALPTRAMVNAIWKAAQLQLLFSPIDPSKHHIESVPMFVAHNETLKKQLGGRSPCEGIIAGHKKDVVICKALGDGHHNDRVAIYGWCNKIIPGGGWEVVQGLNPDAHNNLYMDYSHGIRWVHSMMLVGEEFISIGDVLRSPDLCGIISDEDGPLTLTAYPY